MDQIIVELDDGYELQCVESMGPYLEGKVVHPDRPDFVHKLIRVDYRESLEDSVDTMTRLIHMANDVVKEEATK
jgi:hypothetical protein